MKSEITAKRLIEAMDGVGITQRELSIKAEIKEASVSQYINGSHAPSTLSASKMAKVLNVNPVWLMGFDVPKYARAEKLDTDRLTDEQFARLKSYYEFLLSEEKRG